MLLPDAAPGLLLSTTIAALSQGGRVVLWLADGRHVAWLAGGITKHKQNRKTLEIR